MGHTYGGNGIWQCNQPGIPHGASPHGGNYGNTPWQEAMHYPGSAECAHGKRLLMGLPWSHFTPHPEWAAYTGDVWLPLDDARWLWPNREVPAKDAPNRRAYFRRTFDLPAKRKVASARLRLVGASGHCESQLNGAPSGGGFEWRTGFQFNDRAALLRPGRNVLTAWCEHRPATGDAPGFLACLEIRFVDGGLLRIVTDGDWKAYDRKLGGSEARTYDDSAWPAPQILGELGDAPWGPIGTPDLSLHGPQSAGIPLAGGLGLVEVQLGDGAERGHGEGGVLLALVLGALLSDAVEGGEEGLGVGVLVPGDNLGEGDAAHLGDLREGGTAGEIVAEEVVAQGEIGS